MLRRVATSKCALGLMELVCGVDTVHPTYEMIGCCEMAAD
jgi:hypothetical protein